MEGWPIKACLPLLRQWTLQNKDSIFDGLHLIDKIGVLGDPTLANGGRGQSYLDDIVDYIFDKLN